MSRMSHLETGRGVATRNHAIVSSRQISNKHVSICSKLFPEFVLFTVLVVSSIVLKSASELGLNTS